MRTPRRSRTPRCDESLSKAFNINQYREQAIENFIVKVLFIEAVDFCAMLIVDSRNM